MGLIFIICVVALVTFSLNKIAGGLLHSLVTDGIKSCRTRYFYKNSKIVYKRDSINNLSFLSYHFLTNDSKRKNLLLRKIFLLSVSPLQLQIKKLQNMLMKEVKVFHSRNSLNDSGPWNLPGN